MPADIGRIKLYMGPHNVGPPGHQAPDDLEETIVSFIAASRNTLDIAVQELESRPITDAICAARRRKVYVRLVLESDYLMEDKALADPFPVAGEKKANRRMHGALLKSNVQVRSDLNPAIFHQKFCIRDLKDKNNAAVLTGSTNFTPTGTGGNLNHIVVLEGRPAAKAYQEEFDEIWTGTFGTKRERHDGPPRKVRQSGVATWVLFAPDHAPEMEIMKQMLKAKTRIDFAMFTFAQSSGIDDTMIVLQKSGISVRGILDRRQGSQKWAATNGLLDNNVDLRMLKSGTGARKVHHKLMVIDKQVIIAGSFNYSGPANRLNDENIIVIGDLDETRSASRAKQETLAKYALDEIDRMIEYQSVKVRRT